MAALKSGFYYPNKMARIYLKSIAEMTGPEALQSVLKLADLPQFMEQLPADNLTREFDFADFSAIGAALEKLYGARGERGLGMHAGKASFDQGLKQFGSLSGIGELAFKAVSLNTKLKIGLKGMAGAFTTYSDQLTSVEERADYFVYTIQRCPVCWGRTSEKPICYIATSLIQSGMHWLSEGHLFEVEEVACCAMGEAACVFHIRKELS